MKTIEDLYNILEKVRKQKLALLPTPLTRLENLSSIFNVDLFMKRDDLTGMEFGGNKTRKLEFIWPDLMESNVDCVITGASIQSNWCRQVASACAQTGKQAILYLYGKNIPAEYQGNLLLDRLFGAEIHFIQLASDENMYQGMARTQELVEKRMSELDAEGKVYQYVKVGAPFPSGNVAYVAALLELTRQLKEKSIDLNNLNYIFTPVGSGGTMVGLLVGAKFLGLPVKIVGISTSTSHKNIEEKMLKACLDTAEFLDIDLKFSLEDIDVKSEYCGQYGVPNDDSRNALEYVARKEGVLLDPVYSAKAMAGMLDYLRKGKIEQHSKIVFWHTGGLPAMFSEGMV